MTKKKKNHFTKKKKKNLKWVFKAMKVINLSITIAECTALKGAELLP